jgi:aminoglycoside 6'-N-acetyltransferase I
MKVRPVELRDFPEWRRMRCSLWPEHAKSELNGEMEKIFECIDAPCRQPQVVFVADRGGDRLGGFVEASIHQNAEGCSTSPVGYIEGWWIDADLRQQGIGKLLVKESERWAFGKGCKEMASDTDDYRPVSVLAHNALGYETTSIGTEIRFRKRITKQEIRIEEGT